MMTVREALVATRELLSDPARFTQGALARTSSGDITRASDPDACCFCTVGALNKVLQSGAGVSFNACYGPLSNTAWENFSSASEEVSDPIDVNDVLGHADVIRMFDITIEKLPA